MKMRIAVAVAISLFILVILIYCRAPSYYEASLVDAAVQMMNENKPARDILKALEAKGASQQEAFDIAKEAQSRMRSEAVKS